MILSKRQILSGKISIITLLLLLFFSGTVSCNSYDNSQYTQQTTIFPNTPMETTITVPVSSCRVRKISVIPDLNSLSVNTNNVLENFQTQELNCRDKKTIQVRTSVPLLLEEYPFSQFKAKTNHMFGAQLAGQANRTLPKSVYPTKIELNKRQETIFRIMSLSGVGIARDFFSYGTRRFIIEKKKGKYNFSGSDFLTELSRKYNIDLIGRLSLHYGDPRKQGQPEDMASYLAYVEAVAERYDGDGDLGCEFQFPDCYSKGDGQNPAPSPKERYNWGKNHQIRYWELLKEPAPGRRQRVGNEAGLTPAHSREILKASFASIKAVAPDVKVFFAGMGPVNNSGYTENSYFEEMMSGGGANYFDIAGVDAFTRPVTEKISQYHMVLQKFRNSKPIWVAQTGVPDSKGHRIILPNGGGTPDAQCIYVANAFTKAFAAGAEKVFWGDFIDNSKTARKRITIWDSTGLFETETWKLKPAYFTYKLMAAALYDFSSVDKISPSIYKFTFTDRSTVYVLLPNM